MELGYFSTISNTALLSLSVLGDAVPPTLDALFHNGCLISGDSVTQVTIFGDLDSSRVTLRKVVTRLEARFSQNDSTRVTINNLSQSHFYKISEPLMGKPSLFVHK